MKHLILTCAILISVFCKAQEQKLAKNGFPLRATSIAVTSTEEKLFALVASILFDNSYEIKFSDKDMGIIQTDYRSVKGNWKVKFSFSIKDNIVRIQGKSFTPGLSDSQIINYGMKGSLNLMAFQEMERVAELIPHSKLEYGFAQSPD